jgi:hypothetical protein
VRFACVHKFNDGFIKFATKEIKRIIFLKKIIKIKIKSEKVEIHPAFQPNKERHMVALAPT